MKSIKVRCGKCGLMNEPDFLICARCNEVIQALINGKRFLMNESQMWGVDSDHPELLPPDTFFPDPDDPKPNVNSRVYPGQDDQLKESKGE